VAAVLSAVPAVPLIGGYYVADLTGSGTSVAVGVGFVIFIAVFGANALGLRVSSGFQLGHSSGMSPELPRLRWFNHVAELRIAFGIGEAISVRSLRFAARCR
jgi:hypothetical protein